MLPKERITILKKFGDFKRLMLFLQASDFSLEKPLPSLPEKLNSSGLKRATETL